MIRRFPYQVASVLAAAAVVAACASTPRAVSARRGQISVAIEPNPIVATQASDGRWIFPFVVELTESGGSDVQIRQVRANVFAFGRLPVHQETMTAEEIRERGYPTSVAAGATIRIPFEVRRNLPDASMMENVHAEIVIEAIDESGRVVSASTSLRVRR